MKPKVSVIIPCYNVAGFLPRCLESLRMQTLPDLQIICVNDCSTDNTAGVLKMAMLRDPRIEIYKTKKNSGPGAARNLGIQHATGEYIGFVDPDDCVERDWFEKLHNVAIKQNVQVVMGNVKTLYPNGHIHTPKKKKEAQEFFRNRRFWRCLYFTPMFTEMIKPKFDERYIDEWLSFEYQILASHINQRFVMDAYYVHYENPMGLSLGRATPRQIDDVCEIYPKYLDDLNKSDADKDSYEFLVAERLNYLIEQFYYNVPDINGKVRVVNLLMELWRKIKYPGMHVTDDDVLVGLLNAGDGQSMLDYMLRRKTKNVFKYKMFGVPFMRVCDEYRTRTTYIFGVPVVKRKLSWDGNK